MPRRQNEYVAARERTAESLRHPTRQAILVEYRDEVAARLMADFSTCGIETDRVSRPGQLARVPVCHHEVVIVINGDQPFEGRWLLPCKLRVACPDVRIWMYRAKFMRADRLAETICAVEELIAYGGDLLHLSQQMGKRITGLKQRDTGTTGAGDRRFRLAS